ncbi:hypothetical protein Mapa_008923 [Marchantia paleacea]|nr:hypothetical protein Mapa_008923 [Marchantia paleacea]
MLDSGRRVLRRVHEGCGMRCCIGSGLRSWQHCASYQDQPDRKDRHELQLYHRNKPDIYLILRLISPCIQVETRNVQRVIKLITR